MSNRHRGTAGKESLDCYRNAAFRPNYAVRNRARPHPWPSPPGPQEREPARASSGMSLNSEHSPALENLLPLPGGEGWGEGEREFQLTQYGFGLQRCRKRLVLQRKWA